MDYRRRVYMASPKSVELDIYMTCFTFTNLLNGNLNTNVHLRCMYTVPCSFHYRPMPSGHKVLLNQLQ